MTKLMRETHTAGSVTRVDAVKREMACRCSLLCKRKLAGGRRVEKAAITGEREGIYVMHQLSRPGAGTFSCEVCNESC